MRRAFRSASILAVTLMVPAPAFAWGAVAHRYITGRAIELLPDAIKPLFIRNRAEFVLRSNDPDQWRLMFETEAPNHQIDFGVDDYGPYPFVALPREFGAAVEKFGIATIRRHGTLPWRVDELFGTLRRTIEGFKRNQLYAEGNTVLYAAALAHYIEDDHQPFHDHVNYDGQLTGQQGIHGRFESELFERFESRLTVTPAPVRAIANARDFAFEVGLDSFPLVPQILQADREAIAGKETYDDAYFESFFAKVRPVLERQLAGSITSVASLIVAAWDQAGRPEMKTSAGRPVQRVRKP